MNVDLQSSPVGFMERFVFSENRDEALKELVEGSEEYYEYKLLHMNAKIEQEISHDDNKKKEEIIKEMKELHKEVRESEKLKNNGTLKNLILRNEMHYLNGGKEGVVNTEELWKYIKDYTGVPKYTKETNRILIQAGSSDPDQEEEVKSKESVIDGNGFVKEKLKRQLDLYMDKTHDTTIHGYMGQEGMMEYLCNAENMQWIMDEAKNKTPADKTKQCKYHQLIENLLGLDCWCVVCTTHIESISWNWI
ncbi:hypothetical protein RFI_30518 [Reticulomyxa filosa]|uniref:Uncharacterized protein n=1 Tax=Reticulomyxa filosa TaxID=46433 RepID=X6LZ58_RETFI|nr:hypothetical protein RFI_30518 [Reticulomyxa filosa]|eukprot:ETO06874.1 hypothetical protein RFI_30518 [Reticulomyxa filosa]